MRKPVVSRCLLSFILAAFVAIAPRAARADRERQTVILGCTRPCDGVVAAVRGIGGDLAFKYENVDAIAVNLDPARLPELSGIADVKGVFRDAIVPPPRPVDGVGLGRKGVSADPLLAEDVQALSPADIGKFAGSLPADYSFNNDLVGVSALHAQGKLGQNVVVALIDTGTTNANVVASLSGTVVGGENFVPTDPIQSATSRRNGPHGTWTGTVIAGHVAFGFLNTSTLVRSIKANAPGNNFVGPCPNPPPTAVCFVSMIGTAPAAKIYALKVFDSRGGGSPESRIIAAMDRAITLKRNFNNGMPSVPVSGTGDENDPFKFNSLNIQVVNMSLGGPTLFAGRDVEDQLTLAMLDVGITIAVSAGNDGFPAMTVSSPGTGIGSLTSAAANTAAHERILRDVQFGFGIGPLYRPTTHTQTAFFSSRGPNADGRLGPNVTANGFATFAQGTCQGSAGCLAGTAQAPINLVSGTSFSSPTTAGVAAVLRREVTGATAAQIRNAIIQSANAGVLGDESGRIDQGNGFLNASGALALLQSGGVSSSASGGAKPSDSVRDNVGEAGFRAVNFKDDSFRTHIDRLVPGQVAQFFVPTRRDTDRLVVTLRNVTPENGPAQQNQLFGDDAFIQIADAPTSFNENLVADFVASSATYTLKNPQTGLVRVSIQGDWTNAGRVSADLDIAQQRTKIPGETAEGKVAQDDLIPVRFNVPAGTQQLAVMLFWEHNWGAYPTNDVDLILVAPSGAVNADGATFASPERVVIKSPAAGSWTAFVNGFTINGRADDWQLRVTADGVRLRQ